MQFVGFSECASNNALLNNSVQEPRTSLAVLRNPLSNVFVQSDLCMAQPSTSGISTPSTSAGFPVHPGTSTEQFQKRRSSSRSIKRKKFDDELVESSLVKTSRPRPPSATFPNLSTSSSSSFPLIVQPSHPSNAAGSSDQLPAESQATPVPERKKPRPTPKRVKKTKNAQPYVTKDIGRWKPADDLALIYAVQQTSNLTAVFRGVKFSCKFTLQEIQERWYTLLYDSTISKVAFNAMKQLHPDVISQIQANALFSEAEEKLLATIPSTAQVTTETFQELLDKNPDVFMPMRTAKVLMSHWTLMKNYTLLPDQSIEKLNTEKFLGTFSDAEELIVDSDLQEPRDEELDHEMRASNRSLKREVRLLENELPKWQVLVDSITGVAPADFDNQTLAVLKGRFVRYLMRSREITIGRVTKDHNVDIDLSLEGPSSKVSRKQGLIKLENSGEFSIINEGRRPFYVDGKPVTTGNKFKLSNNSVLEIITLRFVFLVNQDLISAMRSKSTV